MSGAEIQSFLEGLESESRAQLAALLRRAYERGFREGLSAAGAPADAAPVPAVVAPAASSPTPTPIALPAHQEAAAAIAWDDDGADDDEATADKDEGPAEKDEPRPISVRASVGTLLRRIERTFELARFDVDVIICRRGDRDRRQLKSNTALKKYLRET